MPSVRMDDGETRPSRLLHVKGSAPPASGLRRATLLQKMFSLEKKRLRVDV